MQTVVVRGEYDSEVEVVYCPEGIEVINVNTDSEAYTKEQVLEELNTHRTNREKIAALPDFGQGEVIYPASKKGLLLQELDHAIKDLEDELEFFTKEENEDRRAS